jgi:hypothetical protein
MAIIEREEYEVPEIVIDLAGPQGNAFALIAMANNFCKQLGKDPDPVLKAMQESDYDNLIEVFDREFGSFVTLVKP